MRNLHAIFSFFFLTSCNGVFYHPDQRIYSHPSELSVEWSEDFIESGKGESLHTYFFSAPEPQGVVVVHFHGNAQNMTAHVAFTHWLFKAGFNLVTFDYRGYGQSGGRATRGNTIEDGKTILAAVKARYPNEKIFILGQSLGAAVGFVSAALTQDEKLCGMLFESGFASYRSIARQKLASFFLTWPLQWPLSYLISDEYSPIDFGKSFQLPVMFLHDPRDPVVPYGQGRMLYEALPAGNKVWIDVPGGKHTGGLIEEGPNREKLTSFIKANCLT